MFLSGYNVRQENLSASGGYHVSQFCHETGSVRQCNCLEEDTNGEHYIGDVDVTARHPKYGIRPCKSWSETRFTPIDGNDHNKCRNPGGSKAKPWCVVADGQPGPKIGFCDVQKCDFDFDSNFENHIKEGEFMGNFGTSFDDMKNGMNERVKDFFGDGYTSLMNKYNSIRLGDIVKIEGFEQSNI